MFTSLVHVLLSLLPRTVQPALSYSVAHAKDCDAVQEIHARQKEDDTFACLHQLVALSGGTWPPRTTYGDEWPPALRAYHEAYKIMAPSLSTEDISLDDEHNLQRTLTFRMGMKKALESVDTEAVRTLLEENDKADSTMTPADWNGFFACVALCRHAYRWGTIPVAKVIQNEKIVQFPTELDIPWPFLQRRYGISSLGGCVTSNYLCNFDCEEQIVYEINEGMPDVYRLTEYNFGHVFYAIEKLTLPMYLLMAKTIAHFRRGDKSACACAMASINEILIQVLDCYYEIMSESKIPRTYWMRYAQGFQAWGCGEMVDNEYVEYDGLSGNQLLVFQAVDAFLGLESYLPARDLERYIPATQRHFVSSLRKHNFRGNVEDMAEGSALKVETDRMVKTMKAFRQAHRARVRPYLSQPAPERMMMTAGKSVLETEQRPTLKAVLSFLDSFLYERLKKTNSSIA
ncbi:hypothetical protein BDZ89DRAFT_384414 [Hymenopellis radicata]|nr:hypothetical protein BDZ89DRAFT_384414 [Hymenopellis radicata]